MPRRVLFDSQPNFGGGLNLTADASQLQPNEMRRADNARLTEYGGVTRRLGTQRISAAAIAAKPVRAGYAWVKGDGTVKEAVACNGAISLGTYAIPITWAAVTSSSVTETVYPSMVGFRDASNEALYIADGGGLNKIVGTTWSGDIASTPNVSQLAVYNLRLYGTGDSANPQRIYFSALSDGDTLGVVASGGGFVDIRVSNNQPVTALLPLGASLIVFHKTGISRWTGWSIDDIDVQSGTQGISNDVGTIAPQSLVAVENVGYFLTDRGIYEVNEYGVNPISIPIDAAIRGLSQTNFTRVRAGHHRAFREVWFYLPDVGVYTYNYFLKAWSGPQTGVFNTSASLTHSLWQSYDTVGNPILLAGGADGYVRRVDAPSQVDDDVLSDGTGGYAFTFATQCHRFFFNAPFSEKSLRYIYALANTKGSIATTISWETGGTAAGSATVAPDTSGVWGTGTWETGTWGDTSALGKRIQAHGRGFYADITLTDGSSDQCLFSKIEAQAFDMSRRF